MWDGVWVPSSPCGVVVGVLGFWVRLLRLQGIRLQVDKGLGRVWGVGSFRTRQPPPPPHPVPDHTVKGGGAGEGGRGGGGGAGNARRLTIYGRPPPPR